MVSVQSTVDTGHEDMVHDAQMDYYGTKLATCSSDRSIKIFDVKDGTQTHVADLKVQSCSKIFLSTIQIDQRLTAFQQTFLPFLFCQGFSELKNKFEPQVITTKQSEIPNIFVLGSRGSSLATGMGPSPIWYHFGFLFIRS